LAIAGVTIYEKCKSDVSKCLNALKYKVKEFALHITNIAIWFGFRKRR